MIIRYRNARKNRLLTFDKYTSSNLLDQYKENTSALFPDNKVLAITKSLFAKSLVLDSDYASVFEVSVSEFVVFVLLLLVFVLGATGGGGAKFDGEGT